MAAQNTGYGMTAAGPARLVSLEEVRSDALRLGSDLVDAVNSGQAQRALSIKAEYESTIAANPEFFSAVESARREAKAKGFTTQDSDFRKLQLMTPSGIGDLLTTTNQRYDFDNDPENPAYHMTRFGLDEAAAKDLVVSRSGKGSPAQDAVGNAFNELLASGRVPPRQIGSVLRTAVDMGKSGVLKDLEDQALPVFAISVATGTPLNSVANSARRLIGEGMKLSQEDPSVSPGVVRHLVTSKLGAIAQLPADKRTLALEVLEASPGKPVKTMADLEGRVTRTLNWASKENTETVVDMVAASRGADERMSPSDKLALVGASRVISKANAGIGVSPDSPEYMEAQTTIEQFSGISTPLGGTSQPPTMKLQKRYAAATGGAPLTPESQEFLSKQWAPWLKVKSGEKQYASLNTPIVQGSEVTTAMMSEAATPDGTGKLSMNGITILKKGIADLKKLKYASGSTEDQAAINKLDDFVAGLDRYSGEVRPRQTKGYTDALSAYAAAHGLSGVDDAADRVVPQIDRAAVEVVDALSQIQVDSSGMVGSTVTFFSPGASDLLKKEAIARAYDSTKIAALGGVSLTQLGFSPPKDYSTVPVLDAVGDTLINLGKYVIPKAAEGDIRSYLPGVRAQIIGALDTGILHMNPSSAAITFAGAQVSKAEGALVTNGVDLRKDPMGALVTALGAQNTADTKQFYANFSKHIQTSREFKASWNSQNPGVTPEDVYTDLTTGDAPNKAYVNTLGARLLLGESPEMAKARAAEAKQQTELIGAQAKLIRANASAVYSQSKAGVDQQNADTERARVEGTLEIQGKNADTAKAKAAALGATF